MNKLSWLILPLLIFTFNIQTGTAQVSFERADLFTGSQFSITLTAADLRGNGNLDLIVAADSSVIVLLGDGLGGFGPPRSFAVPNNPFFFVLKDFNGDGNLDLAVADFGAPRVNVLLGDGKGGFGPPSSFAVHHDNTGIVSEDFNNDGCLDLASANFGLCDAECNPSGADNTVSVLLGDCNGNFTAAPDRDITVGLAPEGIHAGDFNNDGNMDLVTLNFHSHSVSLLLGNGDGTFEPARTFPLPDGSFPAYGVVGDFNNDGNLDLVTADFGTNHISILLGDGRGGFNPPVDVPVGASPRAIVAADFDGDGNIDLAVSNLNSADVWILLGDGLGGFTPFRNFSVLRPWFITIGDFNNDGLWDLATTGEGTPNNVSVLFGVPK